MSVIINNVDITGYIDQGGIREATDKVYKYGTSASNDDAIIKGAHYAYTLTAQVPSAIKDTLIGFMPKNSLNCLVDGASFRGEMSNFSATILIESEGLTLWNVSFTISDLNLLQ